MRRIYTPPAIKTPQTSVSTTLLNSSVSSSNNTILPSNSFYQPNSYRNFLKHQTFFSPIRGRELFRRSIHRVIEQNKKQRSKINQQVISTFEEAISIFDNLTFMKCVLLKKKLLDSTNRSWTVQFAQQGGLHALLTYLEQISTKSLSLVDAILVNETLQCLRAMMNISELFQHIAASPQYIDSVAKVLTISSIEIRMRVFELLTALCVYSHDGYELVVSALQDFQTTSKSSNIFAVILEQIKFSPMAKHKWSALALLNNILLSTEDIQKRLFYRNTLVANGILSILEQARSDDDADLNDQIDIFLDSQKHDEKEFLENFDMNDNLSIYHAIQLKLAPSSSEASLFLTAMQLLYSTLISAAPYEREKILQNLFQPISKNVAISSEKKLIEQSSQTDERITLFDNKTSSTEHTIYEVEHATVVNTNKQALPKLTNVPSSSILTQTSELIDSQSSYNDSSTSKTTVSLSPPSPTLPVNIQVNISPISPSQNTTKVSPPPPDLFRAAPPPSGVVGGMPPPPPPPPGFLGGIPPPPPPPPGFLGGVPPPPPPPPGFLGGVPPPPPPPPGFLGGISPPPDLPSTLTAPSLGQFAGNLSVAGLSAVVDSIPQPKIKVRRLQWKKLSHTILKNSRFWTDVNKNVDESINFSQLETVFKVNTEILPTQSSTKTKITNILVHHRSIAINVFLKKFNFSYIPSLMQSIQDSQSNLNDECLHMLLKILPTADEVILIHDHPSEAWGTPEIFVHEINSISYCNFRIQTRILIIEFDETRNEFERKCKNVIKIIDFLLQDESIKRLARSLLSIGDFLNYGSYAGNAFGFRLDILNQLQEIRLGENKNLLSVILQISPENFKFINTLKPMLVEDIQLKLVKLEYIDWKKKIDDGFKQINCIEDKQITEQYKPFYEKSRRILETSLDPLVNQCEQREKDLMNELGETDLNEFNYDTCCTVFRQLIDKVEREYKEQAKCLILNKNVTNLTKSSKQKLSVAKDNLNNPIEHNFMDSLMTELKQKKFGTTPARRYRTRPEFVNSNDREYK